MKSFTSLLHLFIVCIGLLPQAFALNLDSSVPVAKQKMVKSFADGVTSAIANQKYDQAYDTLGGKTKFKLINKITNQEPSASDKSSFIKLFKDVEKTYGTAKATLTSGKATMTTPNLVLQLTGTVTVSTIPTLTLKLIADAIVNLDGTSVDQLTLTIST
ncbi:hypothetical protein CROQUDRAFT_110752 [Cronartium quercuum f. sp. fusiforme G11]|uniref:Uncharacterized protein n=1 Tax=Cronartium quercuum f. sp. fusiforme G11 TaxID=708437 RepID=A0A9P6N728_9BASI|nr:hypothetical protein CROQUDRAFT_110752 [Cronartium quercuum f. sp. fusiforme G11]